MARKLWIFGDGSFADMAHHLFSTDSGYQVAGFTVDAAFLKRDQFNGLPVLAYETFRSQVRPDEADVFVGIGVADLNAVRAAKVVQVRDDGYALASFVSSRAHVPSTLVVHPNTMIMDQVNIHPKVRVGANTVIWSNSRIALNADIGSHVWITSAVVGDATVIGDYTFVGLNATIAPFLRVGRHNLIGAAAVIVQDTQDHQIYRGPRSVASRVSTQRLRGRGLIR